ncbi:MAG: hypothetical protein ACQEXJ_22645, partial [Myxococcota bacterium]
MAKKTRKKGTGKLPTIKKSAGAFLSAEEDEITQKQADNLSNYLVMAGTEGTDGAGELIAQHCSHA